jgi:RND family efflux transporter MFP subunit
MRYQVNFAVTTILLGILGIQAALAEKATLVTATQVISQALHETMPLSASAEALKVADISARVDGVVETVFVDDGEWVEKGQKLLVLDREIESLEIAAAKARVNEARARHKDAIRQKKELQSLRQNKAVSESALSSAIANEEAAGAALEREQATLKRRQALLARHTLNAPFAGVVAQKYTEVGEWVKSDSAVVKLLALDILRIRAALPQRYYARLAKDAQVRVVFDALPDNAYFGNIAAV